MTSKEFLRRAKDLARHRGCAVSTISRELFPNNPRALTRLGDAIKKKRGGPSWVECELAVPRLEKMERESTNGNGKGAGC